MDIQALEKRATDIYIKYNALKSSYLATTQSLEELGKEYTALNDNQTLLERSKPFIDDLINKFSETSLKKLEDLLTLGVQRIFQDRDYRVEIKVSEKRSAKCAELYLIDSGHSFLMRDSCVAGGILVVVGFLIQVFYVANLDVAKILFLDEALSNISTQYLDNFFAFVKELSTQIGLTVVLITHDTRFLEYADRLYKVSNGVYSLEDLPTKAGKNNV
jgi:DNA repair exonuclease SbcCD ATPase subunit